MCYWLRTTDVGCVRLVWAGDVAEEEPEEEDEQLGNLDEEEIKKMQSDEVLSLLSLFLFCGFIFFFGPDHTEWRLIPECKGKWTCAMTSIE